MSMVQRNMTSCRRTAAAFAAAMFALAGLWERWERDPGGSCDTFAIITTEANALVAQIHGRMPVIIAPEHYGSWLARDESDLPRLLSLLRPAEARDMQAVPVDKHVNSPTNDDPRCVQPTGPVLRISDEDSIGS